MVEIRNFLNGFVRLETGRHIILCDVWLEDGIFDNSWVAYPRVRDKCSPIAGATHCFISHIHEDHYDLATLSRLDRAVQMLVPDVYPNYLINSRLRQMGFRNVRMLTPGARSSSTGGHSDQPSLKAARENTTRHESPEQAAARWCQTAVRRPGADSTGSS